MAVAEAASTTDLQNTASFTGKAVGISLDVGKQDNKMGVSGVGVGLGSDKGNAASTTAAGVSGIAGNTAVRTGDADTGLTKIFDAAKVQRQINAQVAVTQAFSKEAPKAVATFSANQIADLKKDLANEKDETKKAAISSEIDKWGEGGRYRVALHTLTGALSGGISGGLGAAASASAAPLMQQLQDGVANCLQAAGLSPEAATGIARGIAGLTAAGVGAAVGGAGGAASALTIDANNRQLHPSERQRAAAMAASSNGKYTKEQIEEQMRLMGNLTFGVGSNKVEVMKGIDAISANLTLDPGMPKVVYGPVVMEVAGQANMAIQQFIIANTKDGAGYIPDVSPYSLSNPATNLPAKTNIPPAPTNVTARCANGDTKCITGVGVQQSVPMSPAQQQAAGEYFGNISTQYQRAAALATVTGNAPVVLSFEIAAGVTGLLEQAFKPSMGKVLVDSTIDIAAVAYSRATGVPIAVINEVVERIIKPTADPLKNKIDTTAATPK